MVDRAVTRAYGRDQRLEAAILGVGKTVLGTLMTWGMNDLISQRLAATGGQDIAPKIEKSFNENKSFLPRIPNELFPMSYGKRPNRSNYGMVRRTGGGRRGYRRYGVRRRRYGVRPRYTRYRPRYYRRRRRYY